DRIFEEPGFVFAEADEPREPPDRAREEAHRGEEEQREKDRLRVCVHLIGGLCRSASKRKIRLLWRLSPPWPLCARPRASRTPSRRSSGTSAPCSPPSRTPPARRGPSRSVPCAASHPTRAARSPPPSRRHRRLRRARPRCR